MADVYRIGVSIAMQSNGAEVLAALSKSLLGVRLAADDLRRSLTRAHVAAAGLGAVLVGSSMVTGMVKLADAGREFVHQQSLMISAGISHRDIAVATAAAWKNAGDVMGSSATQNLALIADLRNQLGSMSEAVAVAPTMTRMGVYLQSLTGQDAERAGFAAIRFLDQRGSLVDPLTHQISGARLEQQSRILEAIAAGTRGRVGPDQLLDFQQYARLAGATLSDQGLINLAPVIAASHSGSMVGTQLSSLQQQLRGGIMTQAGATWLENLGIMDSSKVHIGRGGHLTLDEGALKGASQLQADPVSWVRDVLAPALTSHGYTSTDAQAGALLQSHLRSTVIGLLGEILRNQPAFARDAANIKQALGVDQYAVSQATDPTAKMNNFTAAWKNLTTALGSPLVNDTTGAIGKIARTINSLATVLSQHPKTVENLELLTAGIGGLTALSGTMLVAGAALKPLGTGVRALVTIAAGAETAAAGASLLGLATGIGALVAAAAGAGIGLAAWAKREDHKFGYDDPGHILTWKDKLDPFQLFHTSPRSSVNSGPIPTPARKQPDIVINQNTYLDGKLISRTTKRYADQDAALTTRAHGSGFDGTQSAPLPGQSTGAHH